MTTIKEIYRAIYRLMQQDQYCEEMEMSVFKESAIGNGLSVTICTNGALILAHELNGKVMGYEIPTEEPVHKIGWWSFGHDFAIIDDRYLVDYWAKYVNDINAKCVLDMQDAQDMEYIKKYYLPQSSWMPLPCFQKVN